MLQPITTPKPTPMKPFRRKIYLFVITSDFERFFTIIIICNTILMTTDSIPDEADTVQSLYLSNCFTSLPLYVSCLCRTDLDTLFATARRGRWLHQS
jgi:hypothetical protein